MPDLSIITLEALVLIVVPLLVLYLRGKWPLKITVICLFVIPVLWYLTYAPVHELSHALGTYLAGGKVIEIKLIPSFWKGEFAVAWITPVGLDRPWQKLLMSSAPYLLDLVSIIVGAVVMMRNRSRNALWVGAIFMLLSLRPTFDLVCEMIGYYNGFMGDLYNIQHIVGSVLLTSFLLVSLGLSLFFLYVILRRYKGFFDRPPVKSKDL